MPSSVAADAADPAYVAQEPAVHSLYSSSQQAAICQPSTA